MFSPTNIYNKNYLVAIRDFLNSTYISDFSNYLENYYELKDSILTFNLKKLNKDNYYMLLFKEKKWVLKSEEELDNWSQQKELKEERQYEALELENK